MKKKCIHKNIINLKVRQKDKRLHFKTPQTLLESQKIELFNGFMPFIYIFNTCKSENFLNVNVIM